MVIKDKTRLINRPTLNKGKLYNRYYIYIPSGVVNDSAFPFTETEEIIIKIDATMKRLIIEKA